MHVKMLDFIDVINFYKTLLLYLSFIIKQPR